MSADAVFLPARATVREAIVEALGVPHEPACRLYTDGRRVAWLPRPLPGWFRLAAAEIRAPAAPPKGVRLWDEPREAVA